MTEHSPRSVMWSEAQLPAAVAAATSWRGVMRELGLNPSNGGITRTIRRRATLMGLDTSHFRGNRSWSDAVLRQAVTEGGTWEEVLTILGLSARWRRAHPGKGPRVAPRPRRQPLGTHGASCGEFMRTRARSHSFAASSGVPGRELVHALRA
jgi:hypothetical protein